jgi:predicted RNA-binding Zn-ribbon protein involved in translation (DUF1610 family)
VTRQRITNFDEGSRSYTLAYQNTETGTRAVLYHVPDSYRYKWSGSILVDGYMVWSRGYGTKDATTFRDALRDRPVPELNCPECPNDDILVGEKSAGGAKVQRWFDCPDCGFEAPSKIVYGAAR